MGILNVTPDSLWAESRFATAEQAVAAGRRMFDDGAWSVDIGGESTRPGAVPVSINEELDRVLPVVVGLAHSGVISIDPRYREVAEEAVRAGAVILNDVSGKLFDVGGELGVGYVSMHSHSVPVLADSFPIYDDVCRDVASFSHRHRRLRRRCRRASGLGRSGNRVRQVGRR
jgi:dihydropteroate synthase